MSDQESGSNGHNNTMYDPQNHLQNSPNHQESQANTSGPHNVNPLGMDPNVMGQLLVELLKKVGSQPVSTVEDDGGRLFDRVAKQNPRTYGGRVDPVELEDWIRSMEKIYEVIQVPDHRKVSIGAFYLTGKADIWWNTIKERQKEIGFNWEKFVELLREQFYPLAVQKQKEEEFMRLEQGKMSVLQYADKFMELSRFAPEYVASEKMKMTRFGGGLANYIRHQLAGQPIKTYQDLFDRATDVERVKGELSRDHQDGNKRKWDTKGSSTSANQPFKRPNHAPFRGHPPTSEPCEKCGRTNHVTADCREGKNVCTWCGSPQHQVFNCPRRASAVTQGHAKPLRVENPAPPPSRAGNAGRAYGMNRKEASDSGSKGKGKTPAHT